MAIILEGERARALVYLKSFVSAWSKYKDQRGQRKFQVLTNAIEHLENGLFPECLNDLGSLGDTHALRKVVKSRLGIDE